MLKKYFKYILLIFCLFILIIITYLFNTLYKDVSLWDTIMHSLTGFSWVVLVLIIYKHKKNILPKFVIIALAFCFSLTVGTLFEIFEYSMDKIFNYDMQKDIIVSDIYTTKEDKYQLKVKKIEDINKTIVYYNDKEYIINGYLDIGINDTMKDLIVNLFGDLIGCLYFNIILKKEPIGSFHGL